uniref:Uncharacterized protein n=1 Tax=Arundo donax TaxID=35708 RepID=A0A0A9A3Q0_ARUDO
MTIPKKKGILHLNPGTLDT